MDPGPRRTSGRKRSLAATVARLRAENAALRLAAIERQRVLDAEQRLADQLRQIILPVPTAPLTLPGLQVAVRYLPAEHRASVGGDWYHATALADGSVILAVGDVAGHGLGAAAIMAELRHALATLTITTTTDPAQLLGYLNRVLCDREGEQPRTATAVVARFDRATDVLTWAQAGHPAPLLLRRGEVSELRRPPGIMLGAGVHAGYQTARLTLAGQDTLLLYTDGLIEPPGGGPDDRLDDVVESLLECVAEGRDECLTELLCRLLPANPADDMCILAVRRCAEVTYVPELRHSRIQRYP
jgi:serine phosphatase RsbU (regulator of sigma subunit)